MTVTRLDKWVFSQPHEIMAVPSWPYLLVATLQLVFSIHLIGPTVPLCNIILTVSLAGYERMPAQRDPPRQVHELLLPPNWKVRAKRP